MLVVSIVSARLMQSKRKLLSGDPCRAPVSSVWVVLLWKRKAGKSDIVDYLYGHGGVGLLLVVVLVLWLCDCMTEWGEGHGVSVYTFLCSFLRDWWSVIGQQWRACRPDSPLRNSELGSSRRDSNVSAVDCSMYRGSRSWDSGLVRVWYSLIGQQWRASPVRRQPVSPFRNPGHRS